MINPFTPVAAAAALLLCCTKFWERVQLFRRLLRWDPSPFSNMFVIYHDVRIMAPRFTLVSHEFSNEITPKFDQILTCCRTYCHPCKCKYNIVINYLLWAPNLRTNKRFLPSPRFHKEGDFAVFWHLAYLCNITARWRQLSHNKQTLVIHASMS